MRILFVTILSYPLRGGTHLRNWQNINILAKLGSVGIFSVFNQDCQFEKIEGIEYWHHYNIIKKTSFWQLVERGLRLIRRFGLRYYWAYTNDAGQELEQVLQTFKPDLVILEELGVYPYLSILKKYPCQIVFDNHNVEGHLFKQIKCSDNNWESWFHSKFHLPQMQLAEKELSLNSDQIWVCSEDDKSLLGDLYGKIAPTYIVPNAINMEFYKDVYLRQFPIPKELQESPYNFLYLGNFFHPPNRDAAQLLITEIYPRLRQSFPESRLWLVGNNPTPEMRAISQQNPHIIVTGEVEDVRPYLAVATVMLVPLHRGGGTRFKILEALASGCPVVSTRKGAEGLQGENGVHFLLADDVQSTTEAVVKICQDHSLRQNLIHQGYQLVKAEYSWEAVGDRVKLAMADLVYNSSVKTSP